MHGYKTFEWSLLTDDTVRWHHYRISGMKVIGKMIFNNTSFTTFTSLAFIYYYFFLFFNFFFTSKWKKK